MDFNTFEQKAIAEGRIDYDGVYLYQCVDLILQYAALCYGITGERGNAIDYWTNTSPVLLNKFTKIATQDVQRGDIVVLNGLTGNPFGHIMIGTGNNTATTFEGLEQNGSTGNGSGVAGDAIRTRYVSKSRIAGVLRPTANIPTPAVVQPVDNHPAEANTETYVVVVDVAGFTNSSNAANHASQANTVHPGNYHVFNRYNGMINVTSTVGVAGSWINPADNVAPPSRVADPARFTRFASPMNLVTNKQPTRTWDLSAATWAGFHDDKDLDVNTPFVAVGKFAHPLGGIYFMSAEQFGNADQTGNPTLFDGINTVDLSPAPPAPQPAAPAAPVVTPEAASPPLPTESESHSIVVNVKSWKNSYHDQYGVYKATTDAVIKDLDGKENDQHLGHDQTLKVAGFFTGPDDVEYALTIKSHNAGNWYGVPKNILVANNQQRAADVVKKVTTVKNIVTDDIDKIADELRNDPEFNQFKKTLTPRGKVVNAIAEVEDGAEGFLHKINLFKKKYK